MTGPDRQRTGQRNLADLIERIARDIQSGLLGPGMWLKQIDLEHRYAASRPDIRRALDRLAEKRLVRHVPNRGYHVFDADDNEAAEILEIRLFLELAAAERIVARATPEALAALARLADRFDQLARAGSLIDLYDANLAFHRGLLELGGNRELVSLVAELRQRTSSAPANQWRARARIEQSGREHHAMLDAIRTHDTARLRQVIARHILQTGEDAPEA